MRYQLIEYVVMGTYKTLKSAKEHKQYFNAWLSDPNKKNMIIITGLKKPKNQAVMMVR